MGERRDRSPRSRESQHKLPEDPSPKTQAHKKPDMYGKILGLISVHHDLLPLMWAYYKAHMRGDQVEENKARDELVVLLSSIKEGLADQILPWLFDDFLWMEITELFKGNNTIMM